MTQYNEQEIEKLAEDYANSTNCRDVCYWNGLKQGYKAALQSNPVRDEEGKQVTIEWWEKELLIHDLISAGYDKNLAGSIVNDLEKIKNTRNENS